MFLAPPMPKERILKESTPRGFVRGLPVFRRNPLNTVSSAFHHFVPSVRRVIAPLTCKGHSYLPCKIAHVAAKTCPAAPNCAQHEDDIFIVKWVSHLPQTHPPLCLRHLHKGTQFCCFQLIIVELKLVFFSGKKHIFI